MQPALKVNSAEALHIKLGYIVKDLCKISALGLKEATHSILGANIFNVKECNFSRGVKSPKIIFKRFLAKNRVVARGRGGGVK